MSMPDAKPPLTPYADVNALLADLVAQIKATLGQQVVGVYLYGSLVWGDFDHNSSDIDLLAATASDIDAAALASLRVMHQRIAAQYPAWDNRIEVAYIARTGLRTFRLHRSPLAIISPGEPLRQIDAGMDWLINWYLVQERGMTLFGPPPHTVIAPIAKAEFLEAVYDHVHAWRGYIAKAEASRPFQAYAILTLCRAWYTVTHGEQVSKLQAARWTAQQLPEWAALIDDALAWRAAHREPVDDPAATFGETQRFVAALIARIAALRAGV
jgi:predicted nucleotidyltransferase